jgi:hypothetical protein
MIGKFAAEAKDMITAFLRRRNTRVPEKSEGKGRKNAVKKFTSASFPAKKRGVQRRTSKAIREYDKNGKKFLATFF